jgi:hypothetical protein
MTSKNKTPAQVDPEIVDLQNRIAFVEQQLAAIQEQLRQSDIELRGGLLHVVSHIERKHKLNKRVPRPG